MEAAALNESVVETGEGVALAAKIRNTGDRDRRVEVRFRVDGNTVDKASVAVNASESAIVTFDRQFEVPGTYDLAVGQTEVATVRVASSETTDATTEQTDTPTAVASDDDPVRVVDAELPFDWVKRGFNTTVEATVANNGTETATRTLDVTVDGEPVASRSVTLDPGERRNVTVEFEGTGGTVAVNGVEAGQLSAGERATDTVTTTDDGGASGGDVGWIAALLAIAAICGGGSYVAIREW